MAATYRHINMKALARYQIILLGEQRHIGVNNLPKETYRLTLTTSLITPLHGCITFSLKSATYYKNAKRN